jgi:hypothetical protein
LLFILLAGRLGLSRKMRSVLSQGLCGVSESHPGRLSHQRHASARHRAPVMERCLPLYMGVSSRHRVRPHGWSDHWAGAESLWPPHLAGNPVRAGALAAVP